MQPVEDEMELHDEDIVETRTNVSDVVRDLARLGDGSTRPRLRGAVEWNELASDEAWLVSLVTVGFTVDAIQSMSPLDEEATTELLAKLVTSRTITLQ